MLPSLLSTAAEAVEPASAGTMPTAAAAAPAAEPSFLVSSAASEGQQQQQLADQQQQAAEPQGVLTPHQRELQLVLQLNDTEDLENGMTYIHSELGWFVKCLGDAGERCRQQASTVEPGAAAGWLSAAPASQQVEQGAAATADAHGPSPTATIAAHAAPAAGVAMLSAAASAAQQKQQQQAAEGLGISDPLRTHQHMLRLHQLGQECRDAAQITLSQIQKLHQYMQKCEGELCSLGMYPTALLRTGMGSHTAEATATVQVPRRHSCRVWKGAYTPNLHACSTCCRTCGSKCCSICSCTRGHNFTSCKWGTAAAPAEFRPAAGRGPKPVRSSSQGAAPHLPAQAGTRAP